MLLTTKPSDSKRNLQAQQMQLRILTGYCLQRQAATLQVTDFPDNERLVASHILNLNYIHFPEAAA